METYVSSHSPSEIRELILQAERPFKLITKGEMTETSFQLYTKDIPPGIIKGKMESLPAGSQYKTKIFISVDSVDHEKGASMLLYVFSYIFIAIAFIILVMHYPANVWVYIITLAACFLPPPIMKLYRFFESSPPVAELAKEEFLERIKAKPDRPTDLSGLAV